MGIGGFYGAQTVNGFTVTAHSLFNISNISCCCSSLCQCINLCALFIHTQSTLSCKHDIQDTHILCTCNENFEKYHKFTIVALQQKYSSRVLISSLDKIEFNGCSFIHSRSLI